MHVFMAQTLCSQHSLSTTTHLAHTLQWQPPFPSSPLPELVAGRGTGLEWYLLCSQTHHIWLGDNQQSHRNGLQCKM